MINLLIQELKKFIIESKGLVNVEEELNKNIYKISIEKNLKKRFNITNEVMNKINELSIEQLILLKLETASNKNNIVIPSWIIEKLDNIIKFILVKYALSKFNTITDVLVYLKLNSEKDLINIVNNLNYLDLGVSDNDN